MPHLILVNKPFGFMCQFSPSGDRPTLAALVPVPGVYPAGRLDADSEGLLVLTDDGRLQARIADPRHKLEKGYWAQVEGIPDPRQVEALQAGVDLGDFVTRSARVEVISPPPGLWPRDPPIRTRLSVPDSWLDITIREGRNRQIRRMTAKVGLPTLRLIRYRVGPWTLAGLAPGQWRRASVESSMHAIASQPARHRPR